MRQPPRPSRPVRCAQERVRACAFEKDWGAHLVMSNSGFGSSIAGGGVGAGAAAGGGVAGSSPSCMHGKMGLRARAWRAPRQPMRPSTRAVGSRVQQSWHAPRQDRPSCAELDCLCDTRRGGRRGGEVGGWGVCALSLRWRLSPLAAPTGPRRAARGRERAAGRSEPSEQSEAILLTRRNHRTTGWRVGFLPSILPGHVQQGERVLWLPGLARLYDTQLYGRLSCVPPLAAPGTHRAGLARRCSAEQLNQQLARDPRA